MPRRRRHIHARPDEWIVIHRDPPAQGDYSGCGCLILLIVVALILSGC